MKLIHYNSIIVYAEVLQEELAQFTQVTHRSPRLTGADWVSLPEAEALAKSIPGVEIVYIEESPRERSTA